jgi:hypothetical protein
MESITKHRKLEDDDVIIKRTIELIKFEESKENFFCEEARQRPDIQF